MPDSSTPSRRSALFAQLASLPAPQLEQVIVALNAPRGNIPTAAAQPASRVAALFEWVESSVGCGLAALESVLQDVTAATQTEPSTSSPIQASGHSAQQDIQIGESVSGSSIIAGDGNIVQIHHYYGLPAEKPAATRPDRNEKILIDAVWTEVEDRLRQSLHNAILVRLDMAEQRNQVSRPWDSQLRTADQAPKGLPPGTHIADVFDRRDVGGKLLILGNPGSGKTTTMLDLAAVLIQQANDDPEQPIPVMVNLSSWQNAKQSVTDWLVHELKLKYGVLPKLGKAWLDQKTLLPLMDGLDELPPERQEPVVQALNNWLQSGSGPTRLLVCSRIEEYELHETKLELHGAICLEPLTNEQLQSYLNSLDRQILWETLFYDEKLLALIRTPLLLSVAVLANDSIEPEQWRQKRTTVARMEYLLDVYVERRLHEVISSREYPPHKQPTVQQTRHWLTWVAKQLKAQSNDEFLIVRLQPSMLVTRRQRLLYGWIVGLTFGLTFGLFFKLINWLFSVTIPDPIHSLVFWLFSGAVIGLISTLLSGLITNPNGKQKYIDPVENLDLSFSYFTRKKIFDGLKNGLKSGLPIGFIVALISILSAVLAEGLTAEPIIPLLTEGIIIRLIYGLIFGLFVGLTSSIFWELKVGSVVGLAFGLIILMDPLVDYIIPLMISWLLFGFTLGIILVPFFSLVEGLRTDILVRKKPNQGIFMSARNALILPIASIGLLFLGGGFGLLSFFSGQYLMGKILADLSIPFVLLSSLLMLLSFVSIYLSSLPCAQHFSLRLVLCFLDYSPWNYARFLNYATERLLLQRVGGRYRFIHKLVQEHFAAMSSPRCQSAVRTPQRRSE